MKPRYIVALLALLGAAAYGLRWRQNYKRIQREREQEQQQELEITEDIIAGADLTVGEILAFDELAEATCMGACCVETEDFDSFWDEGGIGGTLLA